MIFCFAINRSTFAILQANKEKILALIEPLLWDTTITAEEAYEALMNKSSYGKHVEAKLLGYTRWYKLIDCFEINTIFGWLADKEVRSKLWPKEVTKRYDTIRRILSK